MVIKLQKNKKNKILFWIDLGVTHFGIAKFLQKEYDLFAIYDVNPNQKKEFMNQESVNFIKFWFLWDYVKSLKDQPDFEYLRNFEERYKINLWTTALTDRSLHTFNPFYKFSRNEILQITEKTCKLFEQILDEIQPDFLAIRITDFHRNHMLYEICKAKGVTVLMLTESRLGFRATINSEFTKIDPSWERESVPTYVKNLESLYSFLDKSNRFTQTKNQISSGLTLSTGKKFLAGLSWFKESRSSGYKEMYIHFGTSFWKTATHYLFTDLKRKHRGNFIDKNSVKKIPMGEKFVFFPLQLEPERNTSIDTPFYTNQLELIKNIAKSLPVEYKLYVKEHYNMIFRGWRPTKFYKKIIDLPNVYLIHTSIQPKEIISKCSLVTTISSTAGLDAAYQMKPTIVFGDIIYQTLPSVKKITDLESLPQSIRSQLEQKVKESDVIDFVNLLIHNSFEFDLFELHNKVAKKFHAEGFQLKPNITIDELDQFIDDHKKEYEFLTNEYDKKIKRYNEIKNKAL